MASDSDIDTFTVVVIDDKKTSIEGVQKAFLRENRNVAGRTVVIDVRSVFIEVEKLANPHPNIGKCWTFCESVFGQLVDAAATRPDMIIVDFVYIDSQVQSEIMSHRDRTGNAPEDTRERFLNPKDLRSWIESRLGADSAARDKVIRNIFDASVPIYLHTYTPEFLERAMDEPDVRRGIAHYAFPKARNLIELVDTRQIFYAKNRFDLDLKTTKHDSEFYAHLLGLHFSHLADKQFCLKLLYNQRYLRLNRTAFTTFAVVGVGTIFATATSMVGDIIATFLGNSEISEGILLFVGTLVTFTILGTLIILGLDKKLKDLLPPFDG
jgi:hypothetical protein